MNDSENHVKIARYQELVDRLFLNTITPEEEAEMQQLNTELESQTTTFYAPIAAKMLSEADRQHLA